MSGFNYNISTLFSSLNSNHTLNSFSFSDYASIKNGSYGKLLKAYYSDQKGSTGTGKTSAATTKKNTGTDTTGLTQMKKEADGLKKAAEDLGKEDLWKQSEGSYDLDGISDAVKKFADRYNETLDQAAKVSSKEVNRDTNYMTGMTTTMSKALAKVGVHVGGDGKLTVNEDELKKASVSSLKSMFSGAASYGAQIASKAAEISKDTIRYNGLYGSNGALSNALSNAYNTWV